MLNKQPKVKLPDVLSFSNGEKVQTIEQWRRRRQEIQEILCREEYGFIPGAPQSFKAEILEEDDGFCAGSAVLTKVLLTLEFSHGRFSFPVYCVIPKLNHYCPAFLHISFSGFVPDKYMPSEEICDNGFAAFSFCYNDVTSDNEDFSDGLAGMFYNNSPRTSDSPGKIAIWAWAAMRVMDYIQTLAGIDKKNIAVIGHSRLGKTALLAGAFDDRFAFTVSNNSGCGGAALSRRKRGERIRDIYGRFPYWFCENFGKYADKENIMPFDQHFLLSLIAPRKLYVAGAEEDVWADPIAEYFSCVAAGRVYEFLGGTGFIHPGGFPRAGQCMRSGSIGYHLRHGRHYLSRYDWQRFMEYMNKHKNL